MFDHRNEAAGSQLEVIHLDRPGLVMAAKQIHDLPVALAAAGERPGDHIDEDGTPVGIAGV